MVILDLQGDPILPRNETTPILMARALGWIGSGTDRAIFLIGQGRHADALDVLRGCLEAYKELSDIIDERAGGKKE